MKIDGKTQPFDNLSSDEFVRVTRLAPEERFDYFLSHIKETGELWALFGKNGWVMVESGDELCLPIWPHRDYVIAWERDDFPDCEPKSISHYDFLNVWSAGLAKNNTLLLLFPCGDEEEGIVMSAPEFSDCMQEDLEQK